MISEMFLLTGAWSWLIPLIAGFAAIITLFVSKPKRKGAMAICVILILLAAGLSAIDKYSSYQAATEIQALAYDKISLHTSRFLSILSYMIAEASDGWIPASQDEFFSRKSLDLICRHLNSAGRAFVMPRRPWYRWFGEKTKEYKKALEEVLGQYGIQLPADLIRAISAVERSLLLWFPQHLTNAVLLFEQAGIERPPLLCAGLEEELEKSFANLSLLVSEIGKGEKEFGLLQRMKKEIFLSGLKSVTLGANRFSDEDYKKWAEMHPPPRKKPQGLRPLQID